MIDLTDKKVMLTGANSMIGSRVAKILRKHNVVLDEVFHKDCDLLIEEEVTNRFSKFRPDYVIHCAGFNGGIEFNKMMPSTIFYRTTLMGMNVMNAAASYQVKKFVNVLTSCAYPCDREYLLEQDFLSGYPHPTVECHGYAKRGLFIYGKQLLKEYGLQCIGVVLNNCYGGETTYDAHKTKIGGAAIKKIVDSHNKGEESVVCWGTGQVRRELIYVDDAAEGIVGALKKYNDLTIPINIGWGIDFTIEEIYKKIADIVGFKGKIVFDVSKPDGQQRKLLVVNRMYNLDIYRPNVGLAEGLKLAINHYQNPRGWF